MRARRARLRMPVLYTVNVPDCTVLATNESNLVPFLVRDDTSSNYQPNFKPATIEKQNGGGPEGQNRFD